MFFFLVLGLLSLIPSIRSDTVEWSGVPSSPSSASENTQSLNAALQSLAANTTLIIPNSTYWLAGGVFASNLHNVTVQLDGTLKFPAEGRDSWPTEECGKGECVQKAIYITSSSGLLFTSSNLDGGGVVDGSGEKWWGYANYLIYGEDRPKLFTLYNVTDVVVEDWHFRQVRAEKGGTTDRGSPRTGA